MAADNELRLLSRVVRDRDIKPLLERGVDEEWFYTDDNRAVWRFVRDHYGKYGEVPTAVTVKDNYPTYRLLAVEDTVDYLLDQLAAYRRRQNAIRLIQDSVALIENDNDFDAALDLMAKQVSVITDDGSVKSSTIDLSRDPVSRYEAYLELKNRPEGLLGIGTGFPTIDEATAGLQGGQLVVIIALPKTGKSMLALQMAVNLHSDGYVPLFMSFEMSNFEQQRRHDAMRAQIAHSRLMRGRLNPDEERRYQRMLRSMEDQSAFHLVDSASGTTVSALAARIETLKPDVVFVDGVYLMIDEITGERNSPQALTNITRNLKALAQRINKPIVITTQVLAWKMKGKNVSADAVGYSSSFHQDADCILALQRDGEEDEPTRTLRIVESRNSGPASVDLLWDWEHGRFTEYALGEVEE